MSPFALSFRERLPIRWHVVLQAQVSESAHRQATLGGELTDAACSETRPGDGPPRFSGLLIWSTIATGDGQQMGEVFEVGFVDVLECPSVHPTNDSLGFWPWRVKRRKPKHSKKALRVRDDRAVSMVPSDNFTSGSAFQLFAQPLLERHFPDVRREWSSSLGATDALRRDVKRYAPRVDLAVGPFNTSPGRADMTIEMLPTNLCQWFVGMTPNANPRCLLAIEVVYSGSAKHMLGDLLNASALGLFGLVACHESKLNKVKRNREYAIELAKLGKIPTLFQNVRVISFDDLTRALR